ncbi:MAG: 2-isopropylmalate synthase [Polyangiaceae bacterium]|nr:2-isopropylmalate synthase [Polyangiaceae bacterium]
MSTESIPRPPEQYVRMFDTTLRDGEQSPGATLTSEEKLEVALVLSRLGVDAIEAGFPAASDDDLFAVQTIAEKVGVTPVEGRPNHHPPIICGLARAREADIQRAWEGVRPARFPRVHTFIATSPIHREHKLRMSREQVLAKTRDMVSFARSLCPDIEFSPEDAGRTEPEFLYEVLAVAIECGATTLNIPDTVGYTMPHEFGALIAGIKENVPGIDRAIISTHCHNDLGLATANTLAGIVAGARQAEVTINGIGERAGNCALEELVMALQTRRVVLGLESGIDTTQLMRSSKLVSMRTGIVVQPNKAIVGANAFAHESGIHQDGMLKHQETYEIMRPEMVGAVRTRLVMGKHSGRHAFAVRLRELGHVLDELALEKAFNRFKTLADKKKSITDADLEALAEAEAEGREEYFALEALKVACGSKGPATALVCLKGPDGVVTHEGAGTGPVDAVFKAIDALVQAPSELLEYTVHAVTEGIDALGQVSVRVAAQSEGSKINPQYEHTQPRIFHGHGAETDIIAASAKAYVAALNRLLAALQPEHRRRMRSVPPSASASNTTS